MAGFTDPLENALLDHTIGKTAYPMPSVWLGLFTVAPNDAGTGGTEATYTGYVRKATTGADWAAASGGSSANVAVIEFAPCTAGSNSIVAFGLFDAATGGVLMSSAACSVNISAGITPRFAIGALVRTLD